MLITHSGYRGYRGCRGYQTRYLACLRGNAVTDREYAPRRLNDPLVEKGWDMCFVTELRQVSDGDSGAWIEACGGNFVPLALIRFCGLMGSHVFSESEDVRTWMNIDQEVPGLLGQLAAGQPKANVTPNHRIGGLFMHRVYSLGYLHDIRRRTGLVLHIRFRGTDLLPILTSCLFTFAP